MQIHTEQEALYVACEMEAAAVALYERALRVMEQLGRKNEPLYDRLRFMQWDEEDHLTQFRALYTGLDASIEQQLALSAVAEGVLFDGGLMGAARQGLFQDVGGMLRFAINAEITAAQKYREFAAFSTSENAHTTLLLIAQQEEQHLAELEIQTAR